MPGSPVIWRCATSGSGRAQAHAILEELAKKVTKAISVPTIGIGAGPHCDGQVLVVYDMLGLTEEFKPRFVRRYAEMADILRKAFREYTADVKAEKFPSQKESY